MSIKQTITNYFQKPETNPIQNVPKIYFKPKHDPFLYLLPEKYFFKDKRLQLLVDKKTMLDKQNNQISKIQQSNDNLQEKNDFISKLMKKYDQFKFRNSAFLRVLTHTLQYTTLYGLVVLGFYSSHLRGRQRSKFVFKEYMKNFVYTSLFFGTNQIIYPTLYKIQIQKQRKPMFSVSNILTNALIYPIILLFERNLYVTLRKTTFICAFAMIRDLYIQSERFYLLNPDHLSTISMYEGKRLKHQFQDPRKRMDFGNTRAHQQRRIQQTQKLKNQAIQNNKGQKVPTSFLHFIMPEIYRPATKQQQQTHQRKAAKVTQQILDQRGIKWIRFQQQQKSQITQAKKQIKGENKQNKQNQ